MEELLKKAAKVCQEAEVFSLTDQEAPVVFEANRLKMLEAKETSGLALRIIKDGQLGFSSTTHPQGASWLLEHACEMAPLGAKASFSFPGPQEHPSVDVYSPAAEAFSQEAMIELGQRLIDGVRAASPDVLCSAWVNKGLAEVRILNSRGLSSSYRRSSFSVSIEGSLIRGEDMLFVGEGETRREPFQEVQPLIDSVREQIELSRDLVPAPTGEVPVLFTPRAAASVLLFPLLTAFNGKAVLQGASPLVGKVGEKLFDEDISLWDDPTQTLAAGSRPWDDEGLPSHRLTLVDGGVVGSFLYDLNTAALAGTKSTASASRSLSSLPFPSASVILLREGKASWKEMIAEVKSGLVVDRLLGAGQSNVLGGDFSANVLLGYKIEKGSIVGRVKNTVIAGNVYQVLKRVRVVGYPARWLWGRLNLPPLYCQGITVSTKG